MTTLPYLSIAPTKITNKNRWILAMGITTVLWAAADINQVNAENTLFYPPQITVMGTRTLALKDQQTTAAPTNLTKKTTTTDNLPAAANPLPNDLRAADQWSFMSQELYPGAANIFNIPEHNGTETEVVVAIVDSGVILDHEDYTTLPGYDFVHDPAVGNDGDGRDSDPADPGDWVSDTDVSLGRVDAGCQITDSKWHGTAITGLIGAISDNQLGVAGGANLALLLPVRITGKCGGYVNDLIDGIRWSAGLSVSGAPDNPNPARIINLSIGFPGSCNSRLQSAINDATQAGAILVTAATNNAGSLNTTPYSPATCKNVLTIGAALRNGQLADYSAYGTDIFLLGPGGSATDGIVTTDNAGQQQSEQESDYGYHFGTSFAAAHVSAALATLLSIDPTLDNNTLRALLSNSATTTADDPQCDAGSCGSGRLNTGLAVSMLLDPAFAPLNDQVNLGTDPTTTPTIGTAQSSESLQIGAISHSSLWLLMFIFVRRHRQHNDKALVVR